VLGVLFVSAYFVSVLIGSPIELLTQFVATYGPRIVIGFIVVAFGVVIYQRI
jgi:hypothetical protein